MFGEPKDIDGECNAHLYIGDNYGDNSATIRCQLACDHEGPHQEQFERGGGTVTITWVADERRRCDHGCGQWEHDHKGKPISCPRDADDHEWSDCPFCHPGKTAKTCEACGKPYYERGHALHCTKRSVPEDAIASTSSGDAFDHSTRTTKYFENLLGFCVCAHCQKLPEAIDEFYARPIDGGEG